MTSVTRAAKSGRFATSGVEIRFVAAFQNWGFVVCTICSYSAQVRKFNYIYYQLIF